MTQPAFTFARGGSKGVPGKNIRDLCGKPLIAYAVAATREAGYRPIVSTDSAEIVKAATDCGTICRPPELAADDAPEWEAWQHAIRIVKPPLFISVPAVCPLRSAADIQACVDRFREGDADIVLTVTKARANPAFTMVRYVDDRRPWGMGSDGGEIELAAPPSGDLPTRRQDAPPVFQIVAGCYVASPKFVMEASSMWEGRVRCVEIPEERAVDIDTECDWLLAEALMERRLADEQRERDVRFSWVQ